MIFFLFFFFEENNLNELTEKVLRKNCAQWYKFNEEIIWVATIHNASSKKTEY